MRCHKCGCYNSDSAFVCHRCMASMSEGSNAVEKSKNRIIDMLHSEKKLKEKQEKRKK